jgi:parvulin-like peptidyl-prolyl isomerase
MVKPLKTQPFSMKRGDISAVKSEFGYHIIKLTGHQGLRKTAHARRNARSLRRARAQAQAVFRAGRSSYQHLVYEQAEAFEARYTA